MFLLVIIADNIIYNICQIIHLKVDLCQIANIANDQCKF